MTALGSRVSSLLRLSAESGTALAAERKLRRILKAASYAEPT